MPEAQAAVDADTTGYDALIAELDTEITRVSVRGTVPDDSLTAETFLKRWPAVNLSRQRRGVHRGRLQRHGALHLVPALGRKRLAKLTVVDLDKLWKAKREAGYSANSVRIMRTVLRRALGQAEREGIVSRNMARLSAAPRVRAKEGRTLTMEQARHLLEAACDHRFGVAVLVALTYGLRRGAVLGLHWSALDWRAGTLAVTHGVKRIKSRDSGSPHKTRLVIAELKTPKSRRTLALTPELLAILRQHHARQAEARIAQERSGVTMACCLRPRSAPRSTRTASLISSRSSASGQAWATGILTSCVIPERR